MSLEYAGLALECSLIALGWNWGVLECTGLALGCTGMHQRALEQLWDALGLHWDVLGCTCMELGGYWDALEWP